jgi:hypothetical protein
MRRDRKTTRTHQEVRDGETVTVRVHHYACAQCGSTLYNNEQIIPSEAAEGTAEAATAETEAADEAAAPASES